MGVDECFKTRQLTAGLKSYCGDFGDSVNTFVETRRFQVDGDVHTFRCTKVQLGAARLIKIPHTSSIALCQSVGLSLLD